MGITYRNTINLWHANMTRFKYFSQGSIMWRWWKKGLGLSSRWRVCIFISLNLLIEACGGGCPMESTFLIKFLQVIDPKNVLDINHYEHVPDCCSVMWAGVTCDELSLNITEIRLENMNLSGTIDANSLCKIPSLQVLSLANNLVHGIIPGEISNCLSLTYLNLSSTMLHGKVPASLIRLKNLKSFDISFTNLTGPIPQFEQEIEVFLPATMHSSTSKWKGAMTTSKENDAGRTKKFAGLDTKWTRGLILAAFLPALLILTFLHLFAFLTSKKAQKLTDEKQIIKHVSSESPVKKLAACTEDANGKGEEPVDLIFFSEKCKRFCIDELLKAAANLQGQNFHSTLYKVKLTDTSMFAVKRLRNLHISQDDFRREFTQIGSLKHPNLLPLVAVNSSENEKLLIYGYQKNGSLSSLLSNHAKKQREFPWRQRLSIMIGIARGLHYIARESSKKNPAHGNLKPSNVILGDMEEPLISEYGIWGFLDLTQAFLYSSNGYQAPEKRLTKEADIFSFGVILLELLTGKLVEKGSLNLPKWVKSMVREEWTGEVLDKEVRIVGKQWAFTLLNIALKCVSDLPERRPRISEVLKKIEHVVNSQEFCSCSSTSSLDSN